MAQFPSKENDVWSLAMSMLSGLTGQPTMTKLEYRVIASNAAGQSVPSNTVVVVL